MKRNNPEKKEHKVVEHKPWELEKQTEGLDPEVVKASEELEESAKKEYSAEEEAEA